MRRKFLWGWIRSSCCKRRNQIFLAQIALNYADHSESLNVKTMNDLFEASQTPIFPQTESSW